MKITKRRLIPLVLGFLLGIGLFALLVCAPVNAQSPLPALVSNTGLVTDAGHYLRPDEATSIAEQLRALNTAHGTPMRLVLVDSVAPERLSDYSKRLAAAWESDGVLEKGSLLFVIDSPNRYAYLELIEVQAPSTSTFGMKNRVRQVAGARFRNGEYVPAIQASIEAVDGYLKAKPAPRVQTTSATPSIHLAARSQRIEIASIPPQPKLLDDRYAMLVLAAMLPIVYGVIVALQRTLGSAFAILLSGSALAATGYWVYGTLVSALIAFAVASLMAYDAKKSKRFWYGWIGLLTVAIVQAFK